MASVKRILLFYQREFGKRSTGQPFIKTPLALLQQGCPICQCLLFSAPLSKWQRGTDYSEIMAAKRSEGKRRAGGSTSSCEHKHGTPMFLPRFLQKEANLGLNGVCLQIPRIKDGSFSDRHWEKVSVKQGYTTRPDAHSSCL